MQLDLEGYGLVHVVDSRHIERMTYGDHMVGYGVEYTVIDQDIKKFKVVAPYEHNHFEIKVDDKLKIINGTVVKEIVDYPPSKDMYNAVYRR